MVLCLVTLSAPLALSVPTAASAQRAEEEGSGVGSNFELTFWQSVAQSADRAEYQAYLSEYPSGTFAGLARARIARLSAGAAGAGAAVPAAKTLTASKTAAAQAAGGPASPGRPSASGAPSSSPSSYGSLPSAAPPPADPGLADAIATVSPDGQPADASDPSGANAPPPNAYASNAYAPGPYGTGAYAADPPPDAPPPEDRSADPAAVLAELGPRPALALVPPVALPPQFCSADERNRFYDTVYKPAKEVADQNNQRAILYMGSIDTLSQRHAAPSDAAARTALSQEAAAFRPIADNSLRASTDLSTKFGALMRVPVTKCG
jgi:hypothetical protein